MKNLKLNNRGFGLLEMVIVISLLIGVSIGGAGYYIAKSNQARKPISTPTPMATPVVEESTPMISLETQGGFSYKGSYSITSVGSGVNVMRVVVNIDNSKPDVSMPAHIHTGSCVDLGGVKYPLSNVVDGRSETVLSTSVVNLKAELPLAINVHKSVDEPNIYVACIDLNASNEIDGLLGGAGVNSGAEGGIEFR